MISENGYTSLLPLWQRFRSVQRFMVWQEQYAQQADQPSVACQIKSNHGSTRAPPQCSGTGRSFCRGEGWAWGYPGLIMRGILVVMYILQATEHCWTASMDKLYSNLQSWVARMPVDHTYKQWKHSDLPFTILGNLFYGATWNLLTPLPELI